MVAMPPAVVVELVVHQQPVVALSIMLTKQKN